MTTKTKPSSAASKTSRFFLCLAGTALLACKATNSARLKQINAMPVGANSELEAAIRQHTVQLDIHFTNPLGETGISICSGILITADAILTAAHCVNGALPANIFLKSALSPDIKLPVVTSYVAHRKFFMPYSVEVGEQFAGEYAAYAQLKGELNTVAKDNLSLEQLIQLVIKYNGVMHDIAIVNVSGSWPKPLKPAQWSERFTLAKGNKLYLAGFGTNIDVGSSDPEIQKQVVQTLAEQGQFGGTLTYLPATVLHAAKGDDYFLAQTASESNNCFGDSGGPAYSWDGQKLTIEGIVRGPALEGISSCLEYPVTNYTATYFYDTWIKCALSQSKSGECVQQSELMFTDQDMERLLQTSKP